MYTEQISDLRHLTSLNIPGINNVMAINKDAVSYIRPLQDILNTIDPGGYPLADYGSYPFLANWISYTGSLLNISNDFACQMSLVESEKATTNLKTYQYKLLFDLPNDDGFNNTSNSRGQIIQAFDRREWILIVTENSGAVRLLGSIERGADFSSQLATGNSIKGPANKFTCGFTWECAPEPAYYIAASG